MKKTAFTAQKGQNEIQIGFLDGVLLLQKVIIYPQGTVPEESAMGPMENKSRM